MKQLLEKIHKSHTHDKPIKKTCYNVTMDESCSVLKSEHISRQVSERIKRLLNIPLGVVPAASSEGVFCCGAGVGGGVSSGGLGWLSVKGNSTVTSLSEKKVSLTNCQKRTCDQQNAREERLIKVLTKRLINKLSERNVWSTNFPKRTSSQEIVGKARFINKLSEKNVWSESVKKECLIDNLSVERSVSSTNCQKSTFDQ